jgi:hypothetical protein
MRNQRGTCSPGAQLVVLAHVQNMSCHYKRVYNGDEAAYDIQSRVEIKGDHAERPALQTITLMLKGWDKHTEDSRTRK